MKTAPQCAACNSPRRTEIDARLAAGNSTRMVSAWLAAQGERISFGGLAGHKRSHGGSPTVALQAAQAAQTCASPTGDSAALVGELIADKLTPKQRRFVSEFLVDSNATQAAIRAGYSRDSAHAEGHRLLKNAEVGAAVKEARSDLAERNKAEADLVVKEFATLALSNLKRVAKWGPGGMELLPSDLLDADASGAIQSISEKRTEVTNAQGVTTVRTTMTVKLHDKKGALDSLAKHLGLFVDRVEVSGDIRMEEVGREADARAILAQRLAEMLGSPDI